MLCIVIWSVIFGSLLSYSPNTHVLSATGVPEITMISPVGELVFDVSRVEFNGKISDDLTTSDKLLVKVFEHTTDNLQPIDITNQGLLTLTPKDQSAEFSYSKEFSEGDHKIYFIVTDEDGLSSNLEQSFTIQSSITDQDTETTEQIVNSETITVKSPQGDLGSLATLENTETINTLAIEIGMRPYLANMYLIPKDSEAQYEPGNVPETFLPAEDMTRVPLDYKVLLDIRSVSVFNPLQPIITFFGGSTGKEKLVKTVTLEEGITSYIYTFTPDDENLDTAKSYFVYLNPNEIVPRFLKFTTVSNNYESYQFESNQGNIEREKDYIHGPYSVVTSTCSFCHSTHNGASEFLESNNIKPETNNLCMACHDGTNGSPKLDSTYASNKHSKNPDVSCSSCHDPHNPGTKDNPNSLHSDYNKASIATGKENDASLCFTCHNVDKNKNIKQYYTNESYVNQSGHNITATVDSGSKLNGQIPCSECHETHGSNNIKMLRGNLGNIKINDSQNIYESKSENWNAAEERSFCLKCHNNSTSIYGKTSTFKDKSAAGEPISGHQPGEEQSCASCHGGASQSYMEAAHAPKKGIHVQVNP